MFVLLIAFNSRVRYCLLWLQEGNTFYLHLKEKLTSIEKFHYKNRKMYNLTVFFLVYLCSFTFNSRF
ncbi:hypothetical protein MOUN0_M07844 [Monosporozyma unispora]